MLVLVELIGKVSKLIHLNGLQPKTNINVQNKDLANGTTQI